jgi:hypothetical protein
VCIGRRKDVNTEWKGAKRKRGRGKNNRKKEVNKDVEREKKEGYK